MRARGASSSSRTGRVPAPDVLDAVCRRAKANDGDIVIVAPALNSRLRHYVSDIDGAVAEAEERLAVAIGALPSGASRQRARWATQIRCKRSKTPSGVSLPSRSSSRRIRRSGRNWLERNVVDRASERYDVTVTHIVSRYGLDEDA